VLCHVGTPRRCRLNQQSTQSLDQLYQYITAAARDAVATLDKTPAHKTRHLLQNLQQGRIQDSTRAVRHMVWEQKSLSGDPRTKPHKWRGPILVSAILTYKTLATCQPSYLYNLLQVYHPSQALRSSTQQLLYVPYMSTDFGQRVFSYSSPATWNSIPIRPSPLKTVLPYIVSSTI